MLTWRLVLLENHTLSDSLCTTILKISAVWLLRQKWAQEHCTNIIWSTHRIAGCVTLTLKTWHTSCFIALYCLKHAEESTLTKCVVCWSSVDTCHNIYSLKELLQTIIDCSCIPELISCDHNDIERYTRYYCAASFSTRVRLLNIYQKRPTRTVISVTSIPSSNILKTLPSQKKRFLGATFRVGIF